MADNRQVKPHNDTELLEYFLKKYKTDKIAVGMLLDYPPKEEEKKKPEKYLCSLCNKNVNIDNKEKHEQSPAHLLKYVEKRDSITEKNLVLEATYKPKKWN